jgi:NADH-quinone oxidoreductase subunit C
MGADGDAMMPNLESLATSFEKAGAFVVSDHDFKSQGLCLSAVIPAKSLLSLARELIGLDYFLLDISVLDAKEGFLVTYHFDCFASPARVALRILAPHDHPLVPSLYPVYQGAEWHERESSDFYGIVFDGNPNPVPLLLPDDFDGEPPLRKKEGERAALAALRIFGIPRHVDPSWEEVTGDGGKA